MYEWTKNIENNKREQKKNYKRSGKPYYKTIYNTIAFQ